MKEFSVVYNLTTGYEAIVKAETVEEAKEKVREVIGDDIDIETAWEINKKDAT